MQVFGRVSVLDRGGNGGGERDCEVQYLKLESSYHINFATYCVVDHVTGRLNHTSQVEPNSQTAYIFGSLNTIYIL